MRNGRIWRIEDRGEGLLTRGEKIQHIDLSDTRRIVKKSLQSLVEKEKEANKKPKKESEQRAESPKDALR